MKIEYSNEGFWEITENKRQFWKACDYPKTKKQFVKAGEINFWVETEGKGNPLILIHGGPCGNHCYFHPGMSHLADNNFLIYYDMRGHYMSSEPKDKNDYGIIQDAKDVESLRKALNLGKINILGHSYGGRVAFMYALMYPNSINHIIFCSTPIAWTDEDRNKLLKSHPIAQELDKIDYEKETEKWLALYYKLYYYKPINPEAKYYNELFRQSYRSCKSQNMWEAYDSDKTKINWESDLPKIKIPTLFLWGKHDPQIRWYKAEKIIEKMAKAEIFIFEESAHDPFTDEPDKFAKIVNNFLIKNYENYKS